jgi:hypothetical protein
LRFHLKRRNRQLQLSKYRKKALKASQRRRLRKKLKKKKERRKKKRDSGLRKRPRKPD